MNFIGTEATIAILTKQFIHLSTPQTTLTTLIQHIQYQSDRGTMVPEILMEFKSESVDSFFEVPSRMASDLEGLRANQL